VPKSIPADKMKTIQTALKNSSDKAIVNEFYKEDKSKNSFEAVYNPKTGDKVFQTKLVTILKGIGFLMDAKTKIEKIQSEATPSNFADKAKEYSDDPGSASKGGDYGFIDSTINFVTPFKDAAFSAPIGKIVGPVQTEYGYHLILVEEEKKTPLDEIRNDKKIIDQVKKTKSTQVAEKYMDDLMKKYAGKYTYNPDLLMDPNKNASAVFFAIPTGKTILVKEIAEQMGASLAMFQKDRNQLDSVVAKKMIHPELRNLEGLEKGYDKDPSMLKKMSFEIQQFKAMLFEEYLRDENRKTIQFTEVEKKAYYEKNINNYKENNKPISYEKAKSWIEQDLNFTKDRDFMAKKSAELFQKFKIEIKPQPVNMNQQQQIQQQQQPVK
jgi:hypothetical protein